MITPARAVQIYQLLRQGSLLVMMFVLARSSLSLEEVGQFETLRYIGYLLTTFWVTGLASGYLRIRQTSSDPERWFIFYVLVALLGALLIFGVFVGYLDKLSAFLVDIPHVDYGLPFGMYLLGTAIASVVEHEAIADQAPRRLLWIAGSTYIIQVIAFCYPIWMDYPFWMAMWGLASTSLLRLFWLIWRYQQARDVKIPMAAELKTFWKSASDLSVYGLVGLFVLACDHYLVGHFSDDSALDIALWRYGAQELPFVMGLVGGIGISALADRQLGLGHMLEGLRRRSSKINRWIFLLAIGLMLISPWLFGQLLNASFYPAHVLFNTMLLLVPSRLVLTTPVLISQDMQRSMVLVGLGESLLNIVVSVALMPSLGLLGIAIGTVVAYSVERLIYVWLLQRKAVKTSSYLQVGEWVLLTAVLLIAYAVGTDFVSLLPRS